jgi:hypothetical protein
VSTRAAQDVGLHGGQLGHGAPPGSGATRVTPAPPTGKRPFLLASPELAAGEDREEHLAGHGSRSCGGVRGSVSSQCTSSSSKAPISAVATWPKGRSTSCPSSTSRRYCRAGAVGEHRDHPPPVLLEPGAHPDRLEVQDPCAAGVVGLVGDGGGEAGEDAVRRRQRRGGVRLVDEPGRLQARSRRTGRPSAARGRSTARRSGAARRRPGRTARSGTSRRSRWC